MKPGLAPSQLTPDQMLALHESPDQERPLHDKPDQESPFQVMSDQDKPDQDRPDQETPDHDTPLHETPDHETPDHETPVHSDPFHVPPSQAVSYHASEACWLLSNGRPKISISPSRTFPFGSWRWNDPRDASIEPLPDDQVYGATPEGFLRILPAACKSRRPAPWHHSWTPSIG